jgi:hypothetical protein
MAQDADGLISKSFPDLQPAQKIGMFADQPVGTFVIDLQRTRAGLGREPVKKLNERRPARLQKSRGRRQTK